MKQFSATDIKVDNLSIDGHIDKLKLAAIEQTKSDTAVDVFVYDTSLDSDGGAWRKRTSHTSWYNEALNTATRGGRRDFPAVAVIVAESNKVTIYDGDETDLSMWMVFEQGGSTAGTANLIGPTQASSTSVFMLNGIISITENTWGAGLISANFISEGFIHYWQASKNYNGNISQRNDSVGYSAGDNEIIVNGNGNDVAMTVLPNAPIDTDTGLPVPTIAVATVDGLCAILDDGTVTGVLGNIGEKIHTVSFMKDGSGRIFYGSDWEHIKIMTLDGKVSNWWTSKDSGSDNPYSGFYSHASGVGSDITNTSVLDKNTLAASPVGSNGLSIMRVHGDENLTTGILSHNAYITSNYNTGWMPGDIKLATLSDTTVETVGVDESTEYVVNGTFSGTMADGDFVAWDISTYHTVSDNDLYYDGTGSQYGKTRQRLNGLVVGQQYNVSFDITNRDTGTIWVVAHETGDITGHHGGLLVNKLGRHEFNFVAATENDWIVIQNNIAAQTWRVDNISVKPSGELITNGTFDNNTDTNGWVSANNATLSNTDNNLRIDKTDTTYFAAKQEFATVTGKRYKVCYELIESDSVDGVNGAYFQISGIDVPGSTHQPYNTAVSDLYPSSTGSYSYEFVALSDTSEVRAAVGSTGTYAVWDNISVRLAEDDRSVNNNGLQVIGQITKSPVAPGTDLVAYSGFSPDNYLNIPHISDLNFGEEDYCIMGWYKFANSTITDTETFFYRGGAGDGKFIRLVCDSHQRLIFQYNTTGGENADTSIVFKHNQITTNWEQVVIVRRNGVHSIYVNGLYMSPDANSVGVTDYSDITFTAGLAFGVAPPPQNYDYRFKGSLALWRISKTAPTTQQIEKIYQDEKQLFRQGAKCTLDGTSDAVTALAHDSATDLLHVGTSSGTSVFSGLQRVTSDSEPVTTCIDAQDELVVKR